MKKKGLFLLVGLVGFIIFAVSVSWFDFSKPTAFPTHDQLIAEMNGLFPEAAASVIQDTIFLDERHVYVPFISKEDRYSSSYWVWKKKGWKVAYIKTSGEPRIWKINQKDSSTYHLVWNFYPEEELDEIRFNLVRNRGYSVSEGVETYYPRVQMQREVSLKESPFGALQLPKEWVTFINPLMKMEKAKQPGLLSYFDLKQYMYFGWMAYDENEQRVLPIMTQHNSGFSLENEDIDFVMSLNEMELEFPE